MADTRKSREEGPLHSGNKLKLLVFGSSASYGATMTDVEGTIKAEWGETREVARLVEQAGIEGIIPYVRFRGLGGALNPSGRNFETITWAAGLAEATERIQVFATALIPTINPLLIAKQLTTVDLDVVGHAAGADGFDLVIAGRASPDDPGRFEQRMRGVVPVELSPGGGIHHVEVDLPLPRAFVGEDEDPGKEIGQRVLGSQAEHQAEQCC